MSSQDPTRQGTADLAKGIAVIFMIQVHLTELFAQPAFYSSAIGRFSLFLGGPPVAPVFMIILGYFLGKTRRSLSGLLWRGAGLFLIGLLLNAGLNFHLMIKIFRGVVHANPWDYLFGVDILFLAALSIMILAVLRPVFRKFELSAVLFALLIAAVTPLIPQVLASDTSARYFLAYIGGGYWWSYFPLLPWLAYPVLGFAFWQYRQKFAEREWNKSISLIGWILTALVIGFSFKYALRVSSDLPAYYHHGLTFFVWTALFLGFWFASLSFLHSKLGQTVYVRYLKWLGRSVLTIYAFQWLMIGNLGTWLYKTQSPILLLFWFVVILAAVSALEYLRVGMIDRWANRNRVLP